MLLLLYFKPSKSHFVKMIITLNECVFESAWFGDCLVNVKPKSKCSANVVLLATIANTGRYFVDLLREIIKRNKAAILIC